jgi:DnaK suppressor protein
MTKEELNKFEGLLIDRKAQIEKNLEDRAQNAKNLIEDEANDEGDLAFVSTDNFTGNAIAQQQTQELGEIVYAISKIKDGSYGTCEMCEDPIGNERLEVKPFAKYCIDCREIIENSPK